MLIEKYHFLYINCICHYMLFRKIIMYIKKVKIKNYRSFRSFEAQLQKLTIVVGENDKGKTNFFTALSLPLSGNQIDFNQKRLSISDINKDSVIDFFTSIIINEPKDDVC